MPPRARTGPGDHADSRRDVDKQNQFGQLESGHDRKERKGQEMTSGMSARQLAEGALRCNFSVLSGQRRYYGQRSKPLPSVPKVHTPTHMLVSRSYPLPTPAPRVSPPRRSYLLPMLPSAEAPLSSCEVISFVYMASTVSLVPPLSDLAEGCLVPWR